MNVYLHSCFCRTLPCRPESSAEQGHVTGVNLNYYYLTTGRLREYLKMEWSEVIGMEQKGLWRKCGKRTTSFKSCFWRRLSQTSKINLWYRSKSYGESLFKYPLNISNYLFQYSVVYLGQFASVHPCCLRSINFKCDDAQCNNSPNVPAARPNMSATCSRSDLDFFFLPPCQWHHQISVPMHLRRHIWPSLWVFSMFLPLPKPLNVPIQLLHPSDLLFLRSFYPKFPFLLQRLSLYLTRSYRTTMI